ncbi:hypothetical protein D3C77_607050 [compost metagenome]
MVDIVSRSLDFILPALPVEPGGCVWDELAVVLGPAGQLPVLGQGRDDGVEQVRSKFELCPCFLGFVLPDLARIQLPESRKKLG